MNGIPSEVDTDTRTHRDLDRQAATMRETLQLLHALDLPEEVLAGSRFLFTGCGSSYYAGLSAANLLTTLSGQPAAAVPSSEAWLLPDTYLLSETVVVCISRTATTTEVVRVAELARERGLVVVALTLAEQAPLLDLADVTLSMKHVGEEGRVMTQSFSNLLLAGQWLAASVAQHCGRAVGKEYLDAFGPLLDLLDVQLPQLDAFGHEVAAREAEHYVLLGSGPTSAICSEGVLKLEEMTQLPSESVAALEYRHGPVAALARTSQLVLACSPASVAFDVILAADALELGYRPLVLAPLSLADRFPAGTQVHAIDAELPDWLWGNVCLAFFQYLSWHRTVSLGRDPERVRNLDKTTSPVVDPHVVDLPPGSIGR